MNWKQQILETLQPLVLFILTVGVPYLVSLVRKKVASEVTANALGAIILCTAEVVGSINQTLVRHVKDTESWDATAKRKVLDEAIATVKVLAANHLQALIKSGMPALKVDMFLETIVESQVARLKAMSNAMAFEFELQDEQEQEQELKGKKDVN